MDCVTDFMHACKHARTYARTHREHGILNMDPGFAYHFYGLTPYTSMIDHLMASTLNPTVLSHAPSGL